MYKSIFRFLLCFILTFFVCFQIKATIINQLAYDVVHTQSRNSLDLYSYAVQSIAQTFRPKAARLDGIAVYLDRMGLSNSTDSVRLQLTTTGPSGLPTQAVLATAWVKMTDIPDGNANRGDPQPDNLNLGYQVWFLFDQPLNLNTDSTYAFTLYARRVDTDNQIIGFNGTDGYSGGNSYYLSTSDGRWTNYGTDLNFMTIKDKYSLIGIRRLPWNYNGVMTIESDIDNTSAPSYADSLGRFLQTDENVGGRWGKGVNGKIPIGSLWFWNAGNGVADSLGTLGQKILLYFNGTDTLSRAFGDSLDQWIQRGWIASLHTVGHTGYTDGGPGLDSSHVFKALSYMQNHGLEKIYKDGVWVSHDGNYINTERYGGTPGTPYYHARRTFSVNNFKFIWDSNLYEHWYLYYFYLNSRVDSLNLAQVIFDPLTLTDGVTRTYRFMRNGNWDDANPEQSYKWFNKAIASSVSNDWQIYIYYTHFGKNNGLTPTSIDSIRAVHQIKDSLGIWIPNSKDILNQQAASAFAQVKVENINGKRTINIITLKDWSWGSHVPDPEELYYLTFDCYAAESLDVAINGNLKLEVQKGKDFTEVRPEWTGSGDVRAPMYWYARDDRKFDKLMVIPGKAVPINYPPVLDSIRAKTVNEGQVLEFRVHATDMNGDNLILTANHLPPNAIFTDSGNGAGSFNFSPSYSQAGIYDVTFLARDSVGAIDSELVVITVVNVNNPPVLDSIGAKSVNEGQMLTFRIHANDINGDSLVISSSGIPANAVLIDSGNGSGSFTFNPTYTQSGLYNLTFVCSDTVGAADSELVRITVKNINNAPVLDSIGPKSVTEGEVLTFRTHTTDINGDNIILSVLNIPVNATFRDSANGAGSFRFSADFTQAGVYNVTFIAQDTAGLADSELVNITVYNLNHEPILDSIGPKAVNEGKILIFRVHATDVDAESLRLTVANLPLNAMFVDSGNGSGLFNFNPNCTQAGSYSVTLKATDPYLTSDSEIVQITVNLQHPPSLALPPDSSYKLCHLGDSIFFRISASDPDQGDSLTLTKISSEGELKPSSPIRGIDSLSGNFFWKPAYADTISNPHLLIFRITDKCGHIVADTVQIRIRFDYAPVLTCQDSSYSLCLDTTLCFDHLIGSDSDPDDSLRLELVSGSSCLFLVDTIRPNLLTGSACFLTFGTDSVYVFIFELKDKCGAIEVDTVRIRVRPPDHLITGDPNGDLAITVSDVVYIINYLFKNGPPPAICRRSADVNCDGKVTVSDPIYLINYLFKGGPTPGC